MLKFDYKPLAEQFGPRALLDFACIAAEVGLDSVFVSDLSQPWKHADGHASSSLAWFGTAGAHPAHGGRHECADADLPLASRGGRAVRRDARCDGHRPHGARPRHRRIPERGSGHRSALARDQGTLRPLLRIHRADPPRLARGARQLEGSYFRTERATIYDRPEQEVPIYIAAAGPMLAKFAGRTGGGFTCTSGKRREPYREMLLPSVPADLTEAEGRHQAAYDRMIEVQLSFDTAAARALEETRHWIAPALSPEEIMSVEDPAEMARLAAALPVERAASDWIVSTNPEEVVERVLPYVELRFRHLAFHAPGSDRTRFLRLFGEQVAPRLRASFG